MNTLPIDSVLIQLTADSGAGQVESRAVLQAAALAEQPIALVRGTKACLLEHREALGQKRLLPVGSVEFVHEAIRIAGGAVPAAAPYPDKLCRYLGRRLHTICAGDLHGRWFCKPVELKRFDGIVIDTAENPTLGTPHVKAQWQALSGFRPEERLFISEVVTFVSEWRFYVDGGRVLGRARYDPDGADEAPEPEQAVVEAMVSAYGRGSPYALDVGVLDDGRTVLVEVNDAYAIGFYKGTLTPQQYLAFIAGGWAHIMAAT